MKKDQKTIDLFDLPVAEIRVGNMDYRVVVSEFVAQIIRESKYTDRHTLAADMSRMLGDKDVTKSMLDAYSSCSHEAHNIPAYLLPVLECCCESVSFTDWLVRIRGGQARYGKDVLDTELGRLEREQIRIKKRIANTRARMGQFT